MDRAGRVRIVERLVCRYAIPDTWGLGLRIPEIFALSVGGTLWDMCRKARLLSKG